MNSPESEIASRWIGDEEPVGSRVGVSESRDSSLEPRASPGSASGLDELAERGRSQPSSV